MTAPGFASLKAAITRAAVCLLAVFLSLASWVTMLLLKARTSAATFAMNSATTGKLLQESSRTGGSGPRFSCLTHLVASLPASIIYAKPSWISWWASVSSFNIVALAWDSFCLSSTKVTSLPSQAAKVCADSSARWRS